MRKLTARTWFFLALAMGRLLRAGRYSKVQIVNQEGEPLVRKHRRPYAPLLVAIGGPLVKILNTGGRVLPQRDWEEREQLIYRSLRGSTVRIDPDGTLVLPFVPGETLGALLEDPRLSDADRNLAIQIAVGALAKFHQAGFTHADAMAENVMVDLQDGVANWFDFETVHDTHRPMAWRRADDLRALLATCLLRTRSEMRAETLGLILDTYADEEVARRMATTFISPAHRPLPYHLGQAPLSFRSYQETARLLLARLTK